MKHHRDNVASETLSIEEDTKTMPDIQNKRKKIHKEVGRPVVLAKPKLRPMTKCHQQHRGVARLVWRVKYDPNLQPCGQVHKNKNDDNDDGDDECKDHRFSNHFSTNPLYNQVYVSLLVKYLDTPWLISFGLTCSYARGLVWDRILNYTIPRFRVNERQLGVALLNSDWVCEVTTVQKNEVGDEVVTRRDCRYKILPRKK